LYLFFYFARAHHFNDHFADETVNCQLIAPLIIRGIAVSSYGQDALPVTQPVTSKCWRINGLWT